MPLQHRWGSRSNEARERRKPVFRSFAALGLLVAALSGAAALTMAAWMVVRKLATWLLSLTNLQDAHIPLLSDATAWFLSQLTAPTILFLTSFGLAMIVAVFVLRQVLLAGLRE